MLTIDEVRDRLLDRRVDVVASNTGLSYHTVRRIKVGKNVTPQYKTMKLLSDYLLEQGRFARGQE